MDGVSSAEGESADGPKKNVMVLAASNFPWDLDEALRRRLEKRIYIPLPATDDVKALININLKGLALHEEVDLERLAIKCAGYSCADITNLCRDAAMMPMRRAIKGLTREEIKNLKKEDTDLPLTQSDLAEAAKRVSSSVSAADVERHTRWLAEFGST